MNRIREKRLSFLFFDYSPDEIAEDLSWAKAFSANEIAEGLGYDDSVLNKIFDLAKRNFPDYQGIINNVVDKFYDEENPEGLLDMLTSLMNKEIDKDGYNYFKEFAASHLLDKVNKYADEKEKLVNEILVKTFFAHLSICETFNKFKSVDLDSMSYLKIFYMGLICGRGLGYVEGRSDIFHKGDIEGYKRIAQSRSKTKDHAKKIPLIKDACSIAEKLWKAGSHKNHVEMTAYLIENCKKFKKLPEGRMRKELVVIARGRNMAKGEAGFKQLENNDKEIGVDSILEQLCLKG